MRSEVIGEGIACDEMSAAQAMSLVTERWPFSLSEHSPIGQLIVVLHDVVQVRVGLAADIRQSVNFHLSIQLLVKLILLAVNLNLQSLREL